MYSITRRIGDFDVDVNFEVKKEWVYMDVLKNYFEITEVTKLEIPMDFLDTLSEEDRWELLVRFCDPKYYHGLTRTIESTFN